VIKCHDFFWIIFVCHLFSFFLFSLSWMRHLVYQTFFRANNRKALEEERKWIKSSWRDVHIFNAFMLSSQY
jgi:hypothetical protein